MLAGSFTFSAAVSGTLATPFKTILAVVTTLNKGTVLSAGLADATWTASGNTITFFGWDVAGAAKSSSETISYIIYGVLQ